MPELLAFKPALNGRKPIPLGPFLAHQLFRLDHGKELTNPARGGNTKSQSESIRKYFGDDPVAEL